MNHASRANAICKRTARRTRNSGNREYLQRAVYLTLSVAWTFFTADSLVEDRPEINAKHGAVAYASQMKTTGTISDQAACFARAMAARFGERAVEVATLQRDLAQGNASSAQMAWAAICRALRVL